MGARGRAPFPAPLSPVPGGGREQKAAGEGQGAGWPFGRRPPGGARGLGRAPRRRGPAARLRAARRGRGLCLPRRAARMLRARGLRSSPPRSGAAPRDRAVPEPLAAVSRFLRRRRALGPAVLFPVAVRRRSPCPSPAAPRPFRSPSCPRSLPWPRGALSRRRLYPGPSPPCPEVPAVSEAFTAVFAAAVSCLPWVRGFAVAPRLSCWSRGVLRGPEVLTWSLRCRTRRCSACSLLPNGRGLKKTALRFLPWLRSLPRSSLQP